MVNVEGIVHALSRYDCVAAEPLHDRDRRDSSIEQRSAPSGQCRVRVQQRIRIGERVVKPEVDLNDLHLDKSDARCV